MNEILTLLGYVLIGAGIFFLYTASCVYLFKLYRTCIEGGDIVEGYTFASFFVILIGAGLSALSSVI